MDNNQYKYELKRSNLILDRWLSILNITENQHKAYSSGRTPIPTSIHLLIEKLNMKRRDALEALQETLKKIEHIEHYDMKIDEQNDNLILTPRSGNGDSLTFENQGLDVFLFEVYTLKLGNSLLTLIFYPEHGLRIDGKPESQRKWFVLKAGEDRISHVINDPANELHQMIKISLAR